MNKIIKKFLLAGDKFMPELHLKQPWFTYSACGTFTKNKERVKNFKKTEVSRCIYQNEIDKVCFQHDMAYWGFKDLNWRTAADKVLRDKTFNIAKYGGYQGRLASTVYKLFDKKSSGSSIKKKKNISNKQLAEELHKLIIRKFKKREIHSPFIDNIWGAGLADM